MPEPTKENSNSFCEVRNLPTIEEWKIAKKTWRKLFLERELINYTKWLLRRVDWLPKNEDIVARTVSKYLEEETID